MTRLHYGYVLWGAITAIVTVLIAVPELYAALDKRAPYPTLSTTVTTLIREHPWAAVILVFIVSGGLTVLFLHLLLSPWPDQPRR